MFDCPHCGNQLPEGAAFCNQCWRPVDDPPKSARSAEPAPAPPPPVAGTGAGEPETVAAAGPGQDDRPRFTPAPGGPPPPAADEVTSAYPPVPPPQPPSPWVSGAGSDPSPQGGPWGQPGQPGPYGAPSAPHGAPPPTPYGGPPPGSGYAGPPPGGGYAGPPPGYPPPGYGYPPYGYAPAYPTGPGTNGMAIASLVSALVGLVLSCGFLSPIGIILGHISLAQIKRTGEDGRGMAIAGLVIGYICLAGIIVSVIAIVASSSSA